MGIYEVYYIDFHILFTFMSICVEVIGHICVLLVFDTIDVFSKSIFYFYFCLAYILFLAFRAFYAVYDIRAVASAVLFGRHFSVFGVDFPCFV